MRRLLALPRVRTAALVLGFAFALGLCLQLVAVYGDPLVALAVFTAGVGGIVGYFIGLARGFAIGYDRGRDVGREAGRVIVGAFGAVITALERKRSNGGGRVH